MKDEHEPVTDDEFVLRRVSEKSGAVNLDSQNLIQRVAFEPHKTRDTNGISVFRELFVSPEELAAAGPSEAGYYIVRLPVSRITALGLTVVPDPDNAPLPGHALVPELDAASMRDVARRPTSKKFQYRLANLARPEDILGPFRRQQSVE